MWDSRPRLSGLLTAEGGCPTFKKKHSLNCSTYFFAIPKEETADLSSDQAGPNRSTARSLR